MNRYGWNLLIGIDQFANVLTGGAPDRTLSFRCYQHRDHWAGNAARLLIDGIFRLLGQKNHCQTVYESGDSHTSEAWGGGTE